MLGGFPTSACQLILFSYCQRRGGAEHWLAGGGGGGGGGMAVHAICSVNGGSKSIGGKKEEYRNLHDAYHLGHSLLSISLL